MSIVVLISGNGSNLQAMIDQQAAGKLHGRIALVISNNGDAYGLNRAEDAGIETLCLDHRQFDSREGYDEALRQAIDNAGADLVVLAGFMRILTPEFVNHYAGRMLNVHPSLLPKYKGLNTHARALEAGDDEHGASVHFVTPELDGGPVVIQAKVPIFTDDTADELASRVQVQERSMYPLVVAWYCQGRLKMDNNKAYLDGQELPPTGYAAD
ncbi:phosphoribosylglycinamide formyltransferase [Fluctibacter halophilus]